MKTHPASGTPHGVQKAKWYLVVIFCSVTLAHGSTKCSATQNCKHGTGKNYVGAIRWNYEVGPCWSSMYAMEALKDDKLGRVTCLLAESRQEFKTHLISSRKTRSEREKLCLVWSVHDSNVSSSLPCVSPRLWFLATPCQRDTSLLLHVDLLLKHNNKVACECRDEDTHLIRLSQTAE